MGSDPAFLSQSEQEIESVRWKLSWHFPPLLLPLSSWVRLPRELLWWLIDFNHITRLQKSRQRMKVLGNTTPWNPHTPQYLFTQRCIGYCALKGAFSEITRESYCRPKRATEKAVGELVLWGSAQNKSEVKLEINSCILCRNNICLTLSRADLTRSNERKKVSNPAWTSLSKCSVWRTFVCLYQYLPPKPHEWALSIGLLLFVGVKRIFLFLPEVACWKGHRKCPYDQWW